MNKRVTGTIIALVAIVVIGFVIYKLTTAEAPGTTAKTTIEGTVTEVTASARIISIVQAGTNKSVDLAVVGDTELYNKEGNLTDLAYFTTGMLVRTEGSFSNDTSFIPVVIYAISSLGQPPATSTPTSTDSGNGQGNIRVVSPESNDEVGLPLIIRGQARVFENQFSWRVRDADGTILVEGSAMANSPDIGQFGPFEILASYPAPKGNTGTVEVFNYSARDGSEENMVRIPVRFDRSVDAMNVQVFFGNRQRDPDGLRCETTYAATRRIPRTSSPARAALEELLKGPTKTEFDQGFLSSINSGVKINSLTIVNGVARADFDQTLQANVGGSCRVTSIRSQITNTLKQFSTVKSVVISVNGDSEEVLQP